MITPGQLLAVGEAIQISPGIARLRQNFPELYFSECSEDDVSPRFQPALATAGQDLYLIAGASGHCLKLTQDCASATGILVAAKVDAQ